VRLILAFLLTLFATALRAQQTPEAAAEQYLAAMKAGDWQRTAALMHPEALAELKGVFSLVAIADSTGVVVGPMFGVPNATEFEALSPQEVYARVLGSVSRRAPQLITAMRGVQIQVLGSVREGPETAHVVYRLNMSADGVPSSRIDIISFRRSGDRWLGLLSGDLRSMAESISRAIQQQPR
jgi:hypothetical protein